MKLLRLKITDPKGFRSLASGFEYHFRSEYNTQEGLTNTDFEPFVCAGRNGSGKSNLLEALASIFYQLEIHRMRRTFLPESFGDVTEYDPDAFELEYLIPLQSTRSTGSKVRSAHVLLSKKPGSAPEIYWKNPDQEAERAATPEERDFLLPEYVIGYSSGENEILSLPFFKMRFVQLDEYWHCLKEQIPYQGHPDARLAYLDREYSQAILLCNLLFQNSETLARCADDVGIQNLKSFQIRIKHRIQLTTEEAESFRFREGLTQSLQEFMLENAALTESEDATGKRPFDLNPIHLLEGGEDSEARIIFLLGKCATLVSLEGSTYDLVMDFWVNDATCKAFQANFGSPLELFRALQVLLNLNLYSVSDELKSDIYHSSSHYVTETVPVLASDERIMRFKEFYIIKKGVTQPLLLKELSDGEHQLLHSLGLCLLFRGTNSLFLLDEPETHFNPDWRAQFISRLRQCLANTDSAENDTFASQEMLITTHTPFLISDSKPEKVLVFKKDASGKVTIEHPDYNTLGASINKITMKTFEKTETVGGIANSMIQSFRKRFDDGENPANLIDEIDQQLGDSVEKILLIKAILSRTEPQS